MDSRMASPSKGPYNSGDRGRGDKRSESPSRPHEASKGGQSSLESAHTRFGRDLPPLPPLPPLKPWPQEMPQRKPVQSQQDQQDQQDQISPPQVGEGWNRWEG